MSWQTTRLVRLCVRCVNELSFGARTAAEVRQQEQGHEYVEQQLITLGARAPRAGEDPAAWLRQALDDVDACRLRHRGAHRFIEPRSVSHGCEVIR